MSVIVTLTPKFCKVCCRRSAVALFSLSCEPPCFDYVVPALFGGLVAQTVIKGKKEIFRYLIPLAVCLFFCYCTKVASAYYMLIVIAVSAVVAVMDYLKTEKKEERGE